MHFTYGPDLTMHGFCLKAHFPKLTASLILFLKLCRNNIAEHEPMNITGNSSNLRATEPRGGHKIYKKSYTPREYKHNLKGIYCLTQEERQMVGKVNEWAYFSIFSLF